MEPVSPLGQQRALSLPPVTQIGATLARFAAYFALIIGAALIPVLDLDRPNVVHQNQLFTETSFVELSQLALLVLSMGMAASLWVGDKARALSALLTFMLTAALVRELDYFLDNWVFDGAWQVLMSILVVISAGVLWSRRKDLGQQLRQLMGHPSFGLMFAGASIVLGFSRLFGRSSFWEEFLGGAYDRSVKNLAEESVELLGFSILAVGVSECALAFRRAANRSP